MRETSSSVRPSRLTSTGGGYFSRGRPDRLEAREVVPAREDVDVRERGLHAAGERLVGRVLLERVEPERPGARGARAGPSARPAARGRRPRARPSRITTFAPRARPRCPYSSRKRLSDSPIRVPPFQSTTSAAARRERLVEVGGRERARQPRQPRAEAERLEAPVGAQRPRARTSSSARE